MKKTLIGAALVLSLVTLISAPARSQTAETGTVTVLHGVPGLEVDVYANGDALISGFKPGDQFGPAELPVGDYAIAVRPAGAAADSEPAIAADVTVPAGANATAIAHLDATGNPTLGVFVNDVSPLGASESRITVRHTAAFGAVDVLAAGDPVFAGVTNGEEGTTVVPAGTYPIAVTAAGDPATEAFSGDLTFDPGTAYFVHAVGDPGAGTLDVLVQKVGGLGAEVLGVRTGSGGLRADESAGPRALTIVGIGLIGAAAFAAPKLVRARGRR